MRSYFIRRFLLIIPTVIGATMLIFFLTRILPGGPLETALAESQMFSSQGGGGSTRESAALSNEQIEEMKKQYGFDKPWFVAYGIWLGKIIQGDLGTSFRYQEPVLKLLGDRLPISTYYGLITFIATYSVCIPLGILKALKHRTWIDNSTSVLVFIGYAIPGFALGLLLLIGFAYPPLEWFPTGGFVSSDFDSLSGFDRVKDVVWHSILPLACYLVSQFAFQTMLMKNHLMDNLAADYTRTAVAKGLSFRKSVVRHTLRNSFIPIATSLGGALSIFVTGSFLIEYIFDINGLGLLGYKSLLDRDYPVVMGIITIGMVLLLLGNIVSDIFVALVDPRVRFE